MDGILIKKYFDSAFKH